MNTEAMEKIENNFATNNSPLSETDLERIVIKCQGIDAYESSKADVYFSLIPPNNGVKKGNVYINVIDVSGSMKDPAMDQTKEGGFAYSRLDLVKFSLDNIIANCDEDDYFALVAFSNDANVILPITQMTEQNKKISKDRINEQIANGGTNLWSGLLKGIELAQRFVKTKMCV